ncbi:lysis protein [Pectobacterium polaris]|uniref:lysis system i-spanin subunit Rz n=1 Tax=Pectobacterium polaris TaxID=2042057 RepID=UPI001CF5B8B0|nr:lysis system i-spanin subunit Rz [Pectobacterium polaris]MCA6941344.1 lysis protein [Pectobacterium polaris]MCA6956398.1 lysis protein [Pectobacterium polaris]
MSIIPNWKIAVVSLVAGIIAGGAFCWWIVSTSYDADIATLKSEHALALKSVSDRAAADSEAARGREHGFQQQIAALDAKSTKEREDAKRENERLRNDIVSGKRRVQFASAALATCELSSGAVRSASSMGNATAVQLSTTAGRNILDIRTGINEDQAKLVYLHGYIRALQQQGIIAN